MARDRISGSESVEAEARTLARERTGLGLPGEPGTLELGKPSVWPEFVSTSHAVDCVAGHPSAPSCLT